ncbi:MAG TPA: FmdB family zinc ribbon protein [Euzebyales bacterium]
MPTYEYACRDCGRHLEVVQSFSDDPLQTCQHCGGQLRKVFSAAGIIFKGSGYYVTDTRNERSRSGSTSGSSRSSDGDGSGSSDSSSSTADSAKSTSSDTAASTDAKSA